MLARLRQRCSQYHDVASETRNETYKFFCADAARVERDEQSQGPASSDVFIDNLPRCE